MQVEVQDPADGSGAVGLGVGVVGAVGGVGRLVAIAYFALGDADQGRAKVYDYYSATPEFAEPIAAGLSGTPDAVRATVAGFAGIGAGELIFNPGTDDIDEIDRLADIVL